MKHLRPVLSLILVFLFLFAQQGAAQHSLDHALSPHADLCGLCLAGHDNQPALTPVNLTTPLVFLISFFMPLLFSSVHTTLPYSSLFRARAPPLLQSA
jgi:hypothetical protein